MIGKLLQPEFREMIGQRDFAGLRTMVGRWPPADLAEVIADLSPTDQITVFRLIPKPQATAVFGYLGRDVQESLLRSLGSEDAVAVLNEMAPDDRTAMLEELPPAALRHLLQMLSPAERAVATRLLGYPERSVGRLMTPHFLAIGSGWTVARVLEHIREHGAASETLNVLYVVDEGGRLVDDIGIRDILLRGPDTRISEIEDRHFIALHTTDDEEAAVGVFKRYDRHSLPVIDGDGVLVGIVTADDVWDVAEASATEDIHKIGGTESLEEPYLSIRIARMVRKRATWLVILFLGEMLTASAMGFFEKEIERAVVLALFVPLIISSGGNSGAQAATLIIRALALGELTLGNWWRVMRREILSGLALGVILGTIGFLRITLWSLFGDLYGEHWLMVALTVALSLVGVVLWGSLAGSMLPFLLRRCGVDPATSSAPFVATLVDVTGLVIYFSVASVVLKGTLL